MEVSRHWRLAAERYHLTGEVCEHCAAAIFPPRDVCPECARPAQDAHTFSGLGTVYSFTTVLDAPEDYTLQVPYVLALIELDEGPKLTAQLTDLGDEPVEIGMRVEMVTRKLRTDGERGMIVYGYKFRPVLERTT
jgi:uncharacterized OB-fold protein